MINKKNLYYFIFALFSLNANEFMRGLLNGDNNDTGSCLIRIVKIDRSVVNRYQQDNS